MFGSKKIIEQYESRLGDLKDAHQSEVSHLKNQIKDLRTLVFSSTSSTSVPLVHLEADAVLSQKEEPISLTPEEIEALQMVESEANRILSGTY